jgi:hypothetical protein
MSITTSKPKIANCNLQLLLHPKSSTSSFPSSAITEGEYTYYPPPKSNKKHSNNKYNNNTQNQKTESFSFAVSAETVPQSKEKRREEKSTYPRATLDSIILV